MLLLFLLKTLGLGLLVIGGSIGFVAFLYNAIHYIEEYPIRAKEKIRLMVYAVSALHLVLLFRGFGVLGVGFSLCCQAMFYNLLEDYPNIETAGAGFITAVIMAFLNHMYFLSTMLRKRMGVIEIFGYFLLLVWSVPFAFFLSLTANEDMIGMPGGKKPIRRTFAGQILDKLLARERAWEDR